MNKQDLRKLAIEQRTALSRAEFWQLNDDLLVELKKLDWENYHCVHIFLPIIDRKEVDTFEILSFFKESHPKLKIAVNKTDFKNKKLIPIVFDHEHTVLVKNKYQIPEPLYGKECEITEIDIFLIPLLSYDTDGNRIGYGAGFYDRFLINCKPEALKVGLSFFPPINNIDDVDNYDIKLTHCVTPQKTYIF